MRKPALIALSLLCLPSAMLVADVGDALIPLVVRGDGSAQRYRDALRRIELGEIEPGVRRLQTLHEEIWGRNHMVHDPKRGGDAEGWIVAVSLSELIIESIESLSGAPREFYRHEYELGARTLLDRALAQRDAQSLLRTSRVFPITDSAPIALLAAGDIYFEEDQIQRASEAWEQLRRHAEPGSRWEKALALRDALIATRRGGSEARAATGARLTELGIDPPSARAFTLPEAPRGLPALPFTRGRIGWRSVDYDGENRARSKPYHPAGAVSYAQVPAVGDGWVAVATSRKLLRFDIAGGKQVSEVSLRPDPRYYEDEPLIRFYSVTSGEMIVASYVAAASKGDEYLGFDITVPVARRALKGIRVGSDRTVWDTYRRQTADPFLAELSFNSRPIIQDGRVFALGWRKKGYIDVYLVCLDARTGERIWSSPIVGNQVELTMFGEAAHEPILGDLCVADGAVFCSTNLGVVAKVRASDGHVTWATEYEALRRRAYRGRRQQRQRRPIWARNPTLCFENRLVVTPLDSREIYVLDTHDGRVMQHDTGPRGFMVGILDEHLVFAKSDIEMIPIRDVEGGRPKRFRLGQGVQELNARPALVDGGIVYSTAEGVFYQSLRKGPDDLTPSHLKLCEAQRPTDRLPPNAADYPRRFRSDDLLDGVVTVLEDRILVTSSQRITCFIEEKTIRPEEPR